jgi:hypothetical protein
VKAIEMNDTATIIYLEQTEEEAHSLFTYEVSDEALESVGDTKATISNYTTINCCQCTGRPDE